MKKTILVLFIMCLMLPLSASAQPGKNKKNHTDPTVTTPAQAQPQSLDNIIAEMEASMARINQLVQNCKDSVIEYQRLVKQKDSELANAEARIQRANEQTQEMMAQRHRIANPMRDYITNILVTRKFGTTEQSEIDNLFAMLDTMERNGITVDDERDALSRFQDEQNLYLRADDALNQPYDKQTVQRIINDMNKYFNRHASDNTAQKKQMEELKQMVDIYNDAVKFMRNMVAKVDKYINDGRNAGLSTSDLIWPLVYENVFLQSNPANNQFNADLDKYTIIPWIYDQFDIYYSALKDDCLTIKTNEAYKNIMSLKP